MDKQEHNITRSLAISHTIIIHAAQQCKLIHLHAISMTSGGLQYSK
ncbi:MAG: hypothetical protein NT086_15245 [Proteobacteria bacterium]|nr:hypothetical protein [Pseudomonadota bacterium]